jgi:pilus assembly protein Flp/PilA
MLIMLLNTLAALRTDKRGVTALEYGIIAGVLGLVLITIFTGFGTSLEGLFTKIEKAL